jgi:hypothetical protein
MYSLGALGVHVVTLNPPQHQTGRIACPPNTIWVDGICRPPYYTLQAQSATEKAARAATRIAAPSMFLSGVMDLSPATLIALAVAAIYFIKR